MVDITGVEAVIDVVVVGGCVLIMIVVVLIVVVVVIVLNVLVTDVNDIALVVVDVVPTSKDQTKHFYILSRCPICNFIQIVLNLYS